MRQLEKEKRLKHREDFKESKESIKWLFSLGKGFRKYVFGFIIINMISMGVSLGASVAGKYVVDAATGFNTGLYWNYIAIMIITTAATILFGFLSSLFTSYVSEKFAFSVRAEMFSRVQRSRWLNVVKYHSGDILSRLTGDINTVASAVISIMPTVIVAGAELVIVLFILLRYDPTMAFIGLVVGPLGLIVATIFRKKFVKYQKKLRESESEYYSFFQESLYNFSVLKAFELEETNNRYFADVRKRRLSLVMTSSRLGAFMSVLTRIIYRAGYITAFSWCAYRLSKGDYTYGTMTLFLSLVGTLQGTIKSLGGIIPQTISTLVSARRVREITELECEEYKEISFMPKKVALRAKDVSFSYGSGKVLKDINIEINAGERVGIVGPSGAGKTTFIRLLMSLTEPQSGTLEYVFENGESEAVTPASRRFISFVPQGNTLMSGTIRSNLLLADESADEEKIWKALEIADAARFVRKSEQGLDTPLKEKARGISEGQAQRLAIARAILRDKPVLILDEATSALDESTEKRIFERLSKETDKTCFIITHRSSMLKYCHKIMRISEEGTVSLEEAPKE